MPAAVEETVAKPVPLILTSAVPAALPPVPVKRIVPALLFATVPIPYLVASTVKLPSALVVNLAPLAPANATES